MERRAQREPARREPQSAKDWLELAGALEKAGEQRQAIHAYHQALASGAPAVEINLRLGILYMEALEQVEAIAHLEKVIAEEPGHADALCVLGMLMNDLKRFGDAAELFARALRERPAFPEAHFNLGLARFEGSDLHGAAESFAQCYALNRGEPGAPDPAQLRGRDSALAPRESEMAVNRVKLQHDCEQLEYLVDQGCLPTRYSEVAAAYRTLLREVGGAGDESTVSAFDAARHPLVARTYKRPLYIAPCALRAGMVVNPALDTASIEDRYIGAKPNVVVVDEILTPEALQGLRRFCLESTVWNNIQPGYLGAHFYDGFASELLLQLAWDLRERFPRIIHGLPLQMMWGYKYDSSLQGIGVHADAAAVNVNFWITEDDANLDPEHGGLLVYTHDAPMDWGFTKFNRDSESIYSYLKSVGSVPLRIPYRANRAVIFDSDLFHATDTLRFREGYRNRRINITLLYGLRSGA